MFSKRLKDARNALGISQKDIASKLFISQQAYARYEIGSSSPNPETMKSISEILGVSVDYLLGKTDKKNAAPVGAVSEEDIKVALFGGAEDVTDEMWQEAKAFAEYIKDRERRKKES